MPGERLLPLYISISRTDPFSEKDAWSCAIYVRTDVDDLSPAAHLLQYPLPVVLHHRARDLVSIHPHGSEVGHVVEDFRAGYLGRRLLDACHSLTDDHRSILCGIAAAAKILTLRQRDRSAHRSPQQAQQKQNHPS